MIKFVGMNALPKFDRGRVRLLRADGADNTLTLCVCRHAITDGVES